MGSPVIAAATATSSAEVSATPAVEREVVADMIRRGLPLCAALIVAGAAGWGVKGAVSAACAVAIVLVNFIGSAAILGWSARISPQALMAGALGGFLVRLGLVAVALAVLQDQPWVAMAPLGISVLVTHLGLLVWELRHVSASLAFPGVFPER